MTEYPLDRDREIHKAFVDTGLGQKVFDAASQNIRARRFEDATFSALNDGDALNDGVVRAWKVAIRCGGVFESITIATELAEDWGGPGEGIILPYEGFTEDDWQTYLQIMEQE